MCNDHTPESYNLSFEKIIEVYNYIYLFIYETPEHVSYTLTCNTHFIKSRCASSGTASPER